MFPKLASGGDLLECYRGLLVGQKPRSSLASQSLSQAVIRTVAGFGVVGTGAARFTTTDGAFGERATAHGLRVSQLVGELAYARRDLRRNGHVHILRLNMP
jgi:hypothetical protein